MAANKIGYPNIASAPVSVANGFKNLLAIAATIEVNFKEATTVKQLIKDPSNFVAPAAGTGVAAEKQEETKKEESESEEDGDMGCGLFD